jgi:hypothetical protein
VNEEPFVAADVLVPIVKTRRVGSLKPADAGARTVGGGGWRAPPVASCGS